MFVAQTVSVEAEPISIIIYDKVCVFLVTIEENKSLIMEDKEHFKKMKHVNSGC